MSAIPLICSCGVRAFRDICFPEPGVMRLTCFGCGVTSEVRLSVIAAGVAWQQLQAEAPDPPKVESAPEPKTTGYRIPAML